MSRVKVSDKYRVTLPVDALRRLGIRAGDQLSVEILDHSMVLRRRLSLPSERLRGLRAEVWKGVDPAAFTRSLRDESDARTTR